MKRGPFDPAPAVFRRTRDLGAAETRTLESEISRLSIELAETRSEVTVRSRNLMLDMQLLAKAKLKALELDADILAKRMRLNFLRGDREKTKARAVEFKPIRIFEFEEASDASTAAAA